MRLSADVKIMDLIVAKEFCIELETAKTSIPRYSNLEASPVLYLEFLSLTSRRVSCKKIHISWYKPTVPAWLNFGNVGIAARVSAKFNERVYRICDQAVSANPPKYSSHRGGRGHNPII